MRVLNIIDLGVQTFLFGAVLLSSVASAASGDVEGVGMIAMYGAMYLGPWQMGSCLLTIISKGLYLRSRVIHFLSALAYLGGLALVWKLFASGNFEGILNIGLWVPGFGIPLVLAVFYYYITIRSFRFARARRKLWPDFFCQ